MTWREIQTHRRRGQAGIDVAPDERNPEIVATGRVGGSGKQGSGKPGRNGCSKGQNVHFCPLFREDFFPWICMIILTKNELWVSGVLRGEFPAVLGESGKEVGLGDPSGPL